MVLCRCPIFSTMMGGNGPSVPISLRPAATWANKDALIEEVHQQRAKATTLNIPVRGNLSKSITCQGAIYGQGATSACGRRVDRRERTMFEPTYQASTMVVTTTVLQQAQRGLQAHQAYWKHVLKEYDVPA